MVGICSLVTSGTFVGQLREGTRGYSTIETAANQQPAQLIHHTFLSMIWRILVMMCVSATSIESAMGPTALMQPIPNTGVVYLDQTNEPYIPTECGSLEQHRIRQCADPLYSIGILTDDGENFTFTWTHFVSRTQDYFSQVCDNFYMFDQCIDPYKEVCFSRDPNRGRYQTTIRILDFLCRDGYSEMMRNFECFTRTLTRAEMMNCQAEMVQDTRSVPPEEIIGRKGQEEAICGSIQNYINCVKYPIRRECGLRAWYLVKEVIVRPTTSLLPYCDVGNSSPALLTSILSFFAVVSWNVI